jgi:hypothetical protein
MALFYIQNSKKMVVYALPFIFLFSIEERYWYISMNI